MGGSNFSGRFDKNPDYFDGEAKETRATDTTAAPSLYKLLKELAYQSVKRQKEAADGAAATATAEHPFHLGDVYTKSIQKIVYLPAANLTADNTNNATLIVRIRNADGTLDTIVGQLTTNVAAGNWTAFKPVSIPLTNTTIALPVDNVNLDITPGQVLTWEIQKGGAGVVVPAGALQVFYK